MGGVGLDGGKVTVASVRSGALIGRDRPEELGLPVWPFESPQFADARRSEELLSGVAWVFDADCTDGSGH